MHQESCPPWDTDDASRELSAVGYGRCIKRVVRRGIRTMHKMKNVQLNKYGQLFLPLLLVKVNYRCKFLKKGGRGILHYIPFLNTR